MSSRSSIEWTEATWNPVTGCSHISAGCVHCYAERMALRLKAAGMQKYKNGFEVTTHEKELLTPQGWRKPHDVFLCSMGDLFHEKVPPEFIQRVFNVMKSCRQHRFQVLTKRSQRLRQLTQTLPWPENVWMGVTVEDARNVNRIADLVATPAKVKFLSVEPLLSDIAELPLDGIDWVIVGGESGPGARPMKKEWILSIRSQCKKAGVAFYFKQWGGTRKHVNGRMLDGRTYDAMPAAAERARTFGLLALQTPVTVRN
jgi:protein gp37